MNKFKAGEKVKISTNSVVQYAVMAKNKIVTNAAARFNVELETVTFDGVKKQTKTMSLGQLEDFFNRLHLASVTPVARKAMEGNGEYRSNLDIAPRMIVTPA